MSCDTGGASDPTDPTVPPRHRLTYIGGETDERLEVGQQPQLVYFRRLKRFRGLRYKRTSQDPPHVHNCVSGGEVAGKECEDGRDR